MIKIKADNLNFFYGNKQVLFNVNLEISEKKITALIGPSGCGKSTFLRCINRMNDIVDNSRIEGKLIYDEKDVYEYENVPELRKKIGMVFQKPNPFPMSIKDNVAYGLKVQGIKNKEKLTKWSIITRHMILKKIFHQVPKECYFLLRPKEKD